MATLEAHARRLGTARDLQTLTRTMKAMAAVALRTFERAVESMEDEEKAVETGLQILLRGQQLSPTPPADGTLGLIVIGSDVGLCGVFNQTLATRAADLRRTVGGTPRVLAVGSRVSEHLRRGGLVVDETLPVPSSVPGLAPMVYDLVIRLEAWGLDRVEVLHNVASAGLTFTTVSRQLLPWSETWLRGLQQRPWGTGVLPQVFGASDAIFRELVRQYLFVTLYAAMARSLAAENSARLMAMQQAERNINTRLDTLRQEYNQLRQAAVMEELLDITSGFNALLHPR